MSTERRTHEHSTDDETPACLFTEQHVDTDVFEFLWCPFCGNQSFVENRYDGVHCAGCNASVRVQRWSTGLHAIFGEDTPEFVPPDEDLRQPEGYPVFVEIEETDVGYQIASVSEWYGSDEEAEGDEREPPKQPTEYIRENDAGPSTPFMRWNDRYGSDEECDEAKTNTSNKSTEEV